MITTRFAPSPTGRLHIGGLRSALFSWAWARKNNGKFLLRIEDTDRNRFVRGAIKEIVEVLTRFGLVFDNKIYAKSVENAERSIFNWYTYDWGRHLDDAEKVNLGQFKDEFIQSQRLPLYQHFAWQLIKQGWAYFCFCSKERLERINKALLAKKQKPGYDGYCRVNVSLEEAIKRIKAGEQPVVRFNMDRLAKELGEILDFEDAVVGHVKFNLTQERDFVILKSDGFPTYHLAVVVDDYLMRVTHTIRGYEWISSIPKHVGLYYALGWQMPVFVHLPVILDPSGGKLSKRKGSVAAIEFLESGYLSQGVINFLMYLGFNPSETGDAVLLELEDFVERFDIYNIHKSNPVFDRQKLVWFNKQWMVRYPLNNFVDVFKKWLGDFKNAIVEKLWQHMQVSGQGGQSADSTIYGNLKLTKDMLIQVITSMLADADLQSKLALVKERTATLLDALSMILFFYAEPDIYDYRAVKGVKRYSPKVLAEVLDRYLAWHGDNFVNTEQNVWADYVRNLATDYSIKPADLFMLIRIAVTGYKISPPLFESMQILGVETVVKRLERYMGWLKGLGE